MEYRCEANRVLCSLELKDNVLLKELPHYLFHKWNALSEKYIGRIGCAIDLPESVIQEETCYDERIHLLYSYAQFTSVYKAVIEFFQRVKG
jgi:hypothetical protein